MEWVLVCRQESKIHPAMLKEVFQRPKTGNDTEIDRRGSVSTRDDPSRWSKTNNTLLMQIMFCFGASSLCYSFENAPLPKTGTIVEFSFRCYSSYLPIVQYPKQLFHIYIFCFLAVYGRRISLITSYFIMTESPLDHFYFIFY